MKEFLAIMQNWGGVVLLLVLAVIGIVCSLAGSSSAEERRLGGKDDEHYVLRLPIGRVVYPLILLVAGVVVVLICKPLQKYLYTDMDWLWFVIQLAAAVVFGLLFWVQLAKVIRKRVFVKGDSMIVTPAIGAPIETNFKQIRTVANKIAGRDGGVIGKKIRTKEGNRFEVINTMPGYDLFCSQLESKVELPNLTKKLFKKHDKKEETPAVKEEVLNEPLPQASASAVAETAAAAPPADWTLPEPEAKPEASEPEVSETEPEPSAIGAEAAEQGSDQSGTESGPEKEPEVSETDSFVPQAEPAAFVQEEGSEASETEEGTGVSEPEPEFTMPESETPDDADVTEPAAGAEETAEETVREEETITEE